PVERPFTWDLYWSGSWEENKTLSDRGEFRLGYTLPTPTAQQGQSVARRGQSLILRGQALDRRPFDFSASPPWADEKSKAISALGGGLYHTGTGSRLLCGALDEWGLPARIRSPWIRGAPFAENHQPLMADLKTAVSSTKKPETYLYLSAPWLTFAKTAWRGFISAQAKIPDMIQAFTTGRLPADAGFEKSGTENNRKEKGASLPDIAGGIEAVFNAKTRLLAEGFYTDSILPPRTGTSWFMDPPPLPERKFRLYSMGLLFTAPYWAVSSDLAYSETGDLGRDIYGNLGILINPPTAPGGKPGPLALALAADTAGSRFTGRDGTNPGAGFRTAGKIEYRGKGSSLFRVNTTLRGPGFGETFNRSTSGAYYRFPAVSKKTGAAGNIFPLRITRMSVAFGRDAGDMKKILDTIDGTLGLSLSLRPLKINSSLGINFTAGIKGLCTADTVPAPYPLPLYPYRFDSAKESGEITWSYSIFQIRNKWGYGQSAKKESIWDASLSAAIRFKHGRFGAKIASPDFPRKWNCTLSWYAEYGADA
ncbi:MAG: hypothetical protein FWF29_05320, partial [Treponema sp.]|nr:hypothetical protein [Treponema sp.]